jgi:hypothetical protein
MAFEEGVFDVADAGDDERVFVIVGGDLTSTGNEGEFSVGHRYFQSSTTVNYDTVDDWVGLDLDTANLAYVPGNHDHWYGVWYYPIQRGYAHQLFPTHFRPTPWHCPITKGQLQLDLFGVDSCSHFRDSYVNFNPGAGGGLDRTERDGLRMRLQNANGAGTQAQGVTHRTKAILCHHPLSTDGAAGPLSIESAEWLIGTAGDFDVPVIFTGHTHSTFTASYQVATAHGLRRVREIRCPTTLQVPAELDAVKLRPGFWTHQLRLLDNGTLEWTARLYLYHDGFFTTIDDAPWFRFAIP